MIFSTYSSRHIMITNRVLGTANWDLSSVSLLQIFLCPPRDRQQYLSRSAAHLCLLCHCPYPSMPSLKLQRTSTGAQFDDDGGRRIKAAKSCIDKSKTFDGIVFKSAITPASAYSKMSLPITKRTSKPQSSLGFTYTYPFMPGPTMFQRGYNSQSRFFPSSNGNFLPPVEAPCSSFFSFPFLRHLSAVVLC